MCPKCKSRERKKVERYAVFVSPVGDLDISGYDESSVLYTGDWVDGRDISEEMFWTFFCCNCGYEMGRWA